MRVVLADRVVGVVVAVSDAEVVAVVVTVVPVDVAVVAVSELDDVAVLDSVDESVLV